MGKKNNPGCSCCAKVLIWDLGFANYGWDEFGIQNAHYYFFDWTYVKEWLESATDENGKNLNIQVDFVSGEVAPAETFYEDNPDFNPYTNGVENGNWSGSISGYSLIYWPFPTSDEDLNSDTCGVDPNFVLWDFPGEPDHQFWGGVPEWWNDVATGRWRGRLVWMTEGTAGGSFISSSIGYMVNEFLNELSDVHGMELDTQHYMWPFFPDMDDTTVLASDLTDGVTDMPDAGGFAGSHIITRLEGGEALVSGNDQYIDVSVQWCLKDFGDPESLELAGTLAARNTVLKQQDSGSAVPVDFVIMQFDITGTTDFFHGDEEDSLRQLNRNFYTVAVSDTAT